MVERFDFIESSNILRVSLKFKCQVFDFCFDILDIQITQVGESVPKKSNLKFFKNSWSSMDKKGQFCHENLLTKLQS